MKSFLFIIPFILTLSSCKKDKTYKSFSSKQLDFVNYIEGQEVKFTDTDFTTHSFQQNSFRREFYEVTSLYGKTGDFFERYDVSYFTLTSASSFSVSLNAGQSPPLNIIFFGYQVFAVPDSLAPTLTSVTINGINYTNVYTLKAYKNGQINTNDTATLYHNRQYGIIQLLLPNGKRIIRTE